MVPRTMEMQERESPVKNMISSSLIPDWMNMSMAMVLGC